MRLSISLCIIVIVQFMKCEAEDSKTKCQGCKDLVDGILKGLDKTKNKNFEGGDVDWEEKKLGSYKTSETRLIEILDGACSSSNHKCNSILEEREDDITEWYKKKQDVSLYEHLCVKKAQVCCDDNKFGPDCKECPKGGSGRTCFGRGECEGAGDREGSGKCKCNHGYTGEFCDQCAEQHFETFRNDTYVMCSLCDPSCKTCKGNKSTECITCMEGYREEENFENEDEKKCVDINECAEQADLCPVGKYCANNEGSYTCEAWECHHVCTKCYGPLHTNCFSCKPGMIMRRPFICQDIDECASGAICLGMYEVCVNTIGHYKCECARYFRRDEKTGQCQPDPNIYSRMGPQGAAKSQDTPKKDADESGGEDVENDNVVEDSLSENDIKRLVVAVVISLIGTAAATGNLVWTAIFFCSIIASGIWWASDKSDEIVAAMARKHQEL